MFSVSSETKVFIVCPAGLVTGGAELLHQLAGALREIGVESFMTYYDSERDLFTGTPPPPEYAEYNVRVSDGIEDLPQHIVVVSETYLYLAQRYHQCRKMIWWLSVDNFFVTHRRLLATTEAFKRDWFYGIYSLAAKVFYLVRKGENLFSTAVSFRKLADPNILHCYQSVYAQSFLYAKGMPNVLPLSDYINKQFWNNTDKGVRKNVVLYNPKKGLEFTRKLMDKLPSVEWVALEKMSRNEMLERLRSSKLYIDFGHHPGKDRIPREAVLNHCCIITGLSGSARYFEDVRINRYYKIDAKNSNIPLIIDRIKSVVEDFERHSKNFDFYRSCIVEEEALFNEEVRRIFIKE